MVFIISRKKKKNVLQKFEMFKSEIQLMRLMSEQKRNTMSVARILTGNSK